MRVPSPFALRPASVPWSFPLRRAGPLETTRLRPARILVAGIGNIFLGDDGFGVEVVRRLSGQRLGDGVDVVDFGIRGIHLAYELTGGRYGAAILVDALSRGGTPGTLYAIEPDRDGGPDAAIEADGHNLTPDAVLEWVHRVGGHVARVVIVGCEPATTDESMELSAPVAESIDCAIDIVRALVGEMSGATPCA